MILSCSRRNVYKATICHRDDVRRVKPGRKRTRAVIRARRKHDGSKGPGDCRRRARECGNIFCTIRKYMGGGWLRGREGPHWRSPEYRSFGGFRKSNETTVWSKKGKRGKAEVNSGEGRRSLAKSGGEFKKQRGQ